MQRARVVAAEELLVEERHPGKAVGIDDDIVRHHLPGQLVLGDHHARPLAAHARQRLQRVRRRRRPAVDRGEERGVALDIRAEVAHRVARHEPHLRPLGVAVVGIARHALHHLHEAGRVVRGLGDALERVAADAAIEEFLLLVRAREAREPLGVGELRAEVRGLAELELHASAVAVAVAELDARRRFELVATSADAERIAPGLEPVGGKCEVADGVRHDANGDRSAVLARAHHHAFERAVGRADRAVELCRRRRGGQCGEQEEVAHGR